MTNTLEIPRAYGIALLEAMDRDEVVIDIAGDDLNCAMTGQIGEVLIDGETVFVGADRWTVTLSAGDTVCLHEDGSIAFGHVRVHRRTRT